MQETVTALNKLGIKVISMGPDAAPTTSTAAALVPSTFFSAVGRLTGAVDPTTGQPLRLSARPSRAASSTSSIVNSVKTVATQPCQHQLEP